MGNSKLKLFSTTSSGSFLNGQSAKLNVHFILLFVFGSMISESYVIVNRLENANKAMELVGVKLYQLTDILEITKILFEEHLIDEEILEKIKKQVDQAS